MTGIVKRSALAPAHPYGKYRDRLRSDFWYSCAYCSITEVEATALGFEIDHYVPQKVCPTLVDEYANLSWSCRGCNELKTNIFETDDLREQGNRFFLLDTDDPREHLQLSEDSVRIDPTTQLGTYNVEVLDLNRQQLRQLRKLRAEYFQFHGQIVEGMRALAGTKIDLLPAPVRASIAKVTQQTAETWADLQTTVDMFKKVLAGSDNPDSDPDHASSLKNRRDFLKELRAIDPIPTAEED